MITVNDMEKTKQVYHDVLGFTVEGETAFAADAPMRALTGLANAQVRLSRVQAQVRCCGSNSSSSRDSIARRFVCGIQDRGAARLQLRVQNVDAIVAAMKSAGLQVHSEGGTAVPIPPNLKGALVADPNNFFLTPFAPCDGCAPGIPTPGTLSLSCSTDRRILD
jgi:catechol 2,3-dioxygenase-like lactoylglutathione lyase family enzyme